jgi:replication factor C subunit 2/4
MNLISFDEGFTSKKKYNIVDKYNNISIPWIEKYRPNIPTDILLEPFIKVKIDNMINNKSIPNIIITGEPGTGKTSTILCMVKQLYLESEINEYVLELNASDDRGLLMINNTIYPFCKKKTEGKHKLIILDECDSITQKAQNLLSNIISEFKKNCRFVFICNDCSQIIEPIQSNCMIIKYPSISKNNLYKKIEYICKKENIKYNDAGINSLIFASDSDIRQILNNLECIYYTFSELTNESVYSIIDKPKPIYIQQIIKECLNGNLNKAIETTKDLYNKGYYPNDILSIFMKCLLENSIDSKIELNETIKLKIYEIISLYYIRVNTGIDTLLQLCGCIAKIYITMNDNKNIII